MVDATAITYTPTGTGAVVRNVDLKIKESGVSPEDYGAVGDGITDDSTSFAAMFLALENISKNAQEGLRGAPRINLIGNYRISSLLHIKGFTAVWQGRSGSSGAGLGSYTTIEFTDGAGFILDRADTPDNTLPFGSDGSIFENITFRGSAGGNQPLVTAHARFHFNNTSCVGGGSHGLLIQADATATGPTRGEASISSIRGGAFSGNLGSGIRAEGADANACTATGYDAVGNARYGIEDLSFLGNSWMGHHGVNTLGPYTSNNVNARALFLGCYTESGQPPASISQNSIIVGGTQGASVGQNSPYVYGYFGTVGVNGLTARRFTGPNEIGTQIELGTDATQGIILSASGGSYTNVASFRFRGKDCVWGIGYGDADISHYWTGVGTTLTFGRSSPQVNVHSFRQIALGPDLNGRIITSDAYPPSTDNHAAGEIVFNRNPMAGGKVGWVCVASGSPGVWKAFGSIDA